MSRTLLGMIATALVVVGMFVATQDGSNYAAERTQQVEVREAERTARQAIIEAERTERMRLDAERERAAAAAQERTVQTILIVLLAGGIVLAVVVVVLRSPRQAQPTVVYLPAPQPAHPTPPPTVIVLAQQLPEYRPTLQDGRWILESDRDWMTPETAQRLLVQRR